MPTHRAYTRRASSHGRAHSRKSASERRHHTKTHHTGRGQSTYNKFVASHLRGGKMTMAEAARLWHQHKHRM